jgi:hypothetical protein
MEWIDGVKLTNKPAMDAAGQNIVDYVDIGIECTLRQLLEHGYFHAGLPPIPATIVHARHVIRSSVHCSFKRKKSHYKHCSCAFETRFKAHEQCFLFMPLLMRLSFLGCSVRRLLSTAQHCCRRCAFLLSMERFSESRFECNRRRVFLVSCLLSMHVMQILTQETCWRHQMAS